MIVQRVLSGLKDQLIAWRTSRTRCLLDPPDPSELVQQPFQHECELRQYLKNREVSVVFDVGACNAVDSIRYSKLFPTATVYAFEPLPQNIKQAKKNIRAFGGDRVKLVEAALSDSIGPAEFYVSGGHPPGYKASADWQFGAMSSSLLEPDEVAIQSQWSWLEFRKTTTIETLTLNHFCEANEISEVGLMHLDVQGAELKVLNGAGDFLSKIHAIWLEVSSEKFYRNQPLASELCIRLSDAGFNRMHSSGAGPQWDELWVRA